MAINYVPMSLPQGTAGAGGISDPADEAMLKRYYLEQMARSLDAQPVQSWTQGAAKMMQAAMAGMQLRRMRDERQQNMSSAADMIAKALNGNPQAPGGGITGQGAPPPPPSAAVSPPPPSPPPAQTMPIPGGAVPHVAGFPIGAEGEGGGPATMMPGVGVSAPVPPPNSAPPPIAPPVDPSMARVGDNQPMNALSRFDDSGKWMGPAGGSPPVAATPPPAPPPQAAAPGVSPDMLPQIAMALNAPPDAQAAPPSPAPADAPPSFNGPTSPAQMQALVAALNGDQGVTMSTPPAAPSGPLDSRYVDAIKGFEGFTPRATWDYKQNTNGYGTRARSPGEVIDRPTAETRLTEELTKARNIVDQFAPNAPDGVKAALTSLTYNAGDKWTRSGLGAAVQAGDYQKASQLFQQYNKAGGQVLPGLVDRRRAEASWMNGGGGGPTPPVQIAQAGGGNGSISPDTLRQMMMNPYTRDFALKMVGNQLDPSNRLKLEGMELDNATKRRDLNMPKDTLQKVKAPDGSEVLVQVDPRTGAARMVYGDPSGQRKLAPDERKAILESDDALAASKNVLGTLDQLDQLNRSAYDGPTAGLRSTVMAPLGSKSAQDTQVLNNLTTEKALQQLRTTFGGNPTEGERKVLLDLQGSANQPAAVRQRIFNNARQAVQKRIAIEQQRAGQMRSGNYFQPGGGSAAGIEGAKTIGNSTYVKINGQWFQQ